MKHILILIVCLFSLKLSAQDTTIVDNFQKTDEVLSTIVQKALVIAEQTGEFVIEQAPLLLQEFYRWHIGSSIFWAIFGIGIMILGYRLPFLFPNVTEKTSYYDRKYFNRWFYDSSGAWISFFVGIFLGSVLFLMNLYNLMYILVAPKLYLIDYFINPSCSNC